jgi:HAD superfamily hydrolase (TIGR01484 family)
MKTQNTLIVCDRDHSAFSLNGDGNMTEKQAEIVNIAMGHVTKQLYEKGIIFALCSGNDFQTLNASNINYEWEVPFISSKCGTELFEKTGNHYAKDEDFEALMKVNFDWKEILFLLKTRLPIKNITFIPHPEAKNGEGKASGWAYLGKFTPLMLEDFLNGAFSHLYDVKFQFSHIKDEVEAFRTLGIDPNGVYNLDALSTRAGKGSALKKMAEKVKADNIIVMGDSMNDRELFDYDNVTGLLPNNASDELKNYVAKKLDKSNVYQSDLPAGAALIDYLACEGLINVTPHEFDDLYGFVKQYRSITKQI